MRKNTVKCTAYNTNTPGLEGVPPKKGAYLGAVDKCVGLCRAGAKPYTPFLINDISELHATFLWLCRGVGFWTAWVYRRGIWVVCRMESNQ